MLVIGPKYHPSSQVFGITTVNSLCGLISCSIYRHSWSLHVDLSCSFPRFWFVGSPGISHHPAGPPAMTLCSFHLRISLASILCSCPFGISCDSQCFINFIFLSALVWVISIGHCSVFGIRPSNKFFTAEFFIAFPALEQVTGSFVGTISLLQLTVLSSFSHARIMLLHVPSRYQKSS